MWTVGVMIWTTYAAVLLIRQVVAIGPPVCTKIQQYDAVKHACVCKNNLEGRNCDQDSSLCRGHKCKNDDACSKYVGAPGTPWCIAPMYQVHILEPFETTRKVSTTYIHYIEEQTTTLYSKHSPNTSLNLKVEIVGAVRVKSHPARLLISLIMYKNHSVYVPAADACKALDGSHYNCMKHSECKMLKDNDMWCPVPWKPKPVPILTGGVIGLIVAASVVLLTLAIIGLVVKIRRRYYIEHRSVSLEELTEEFDDY